MSRQSHYQIYFGDNKKNSKALCQENHEIIYSKKKTQTKTIFQQNLLNQRKYVTLLRR